MPEHIMKEAVEIGRGVFWVGTLDPDLRVFDVIVPTEFGTSYNAYILKGSGKTALVEVAKEEFFDEFMERLGPVASPQQIDYVIVDHTEPDHTGSLARLYDLNPEIEVVGTASAIRYILKITDRPLKTRVVKDGDTLDLGGKTLKFIMAPLLHWPDTMFTYCPEDKILYTCDVFGCHYCPAPERLFSDEQKPESYMEAYKYYFDSIMSPFKPFVLAALAKIEGLSIDMICTGHGPVIRSEVDKYLKLYHRWATVEKPEKPYVVIAYCSAYGYTRKLAGEVAKGVADGGAGVFSFDMADHIIDEIVDKTALASGILIGSPTFVGDALPPVWELLSRLNPFVHKGKIAGAFGAYGWSGEAVPNIEQRFAQLRLKVPVEGLRVNFCPNVDELKQAYEFGKKFGAEAVK